MANRYRTTSSGVFDRAHDLFDETGLLLGSWTMDLGPWSNNQINKVYEDFSAAKGYADVHAVQDGASFYCYGSVLDNQTSDPITVPPQ